MNSNENQDQPPLSKTSSSSVVKDARPANLEGRELEEIARNGADEIRHMTGLDSPYFFDICLSCAKEAASLSARPATTEVKMEKDL